MAESVTGDSRSAASGPPRQRAPRKHRRAVVIAAMLTLVVAGVIFGRWLVYRLSHSITGDAFVESDMINLAPQVAREIVEMLVQDNQRVSKGERLCRIDPTIFLRDVETATANLKVSDADLQVAVIAHQSLDRRVPEQIARVEQELAVARSEQRAAEQSLARTRETVAHEIARAEQDLAAAKANLDFADITVKRYDALLEGRAVGKEERDALSVCRVCHCRISSSAPRGSGRRVRPSACPSTRAADWRVSSTWRARAARRRWRATPRPFSRPSGR